MKYHAVIMAPQLVEFECEGKTAHITNHALAQCAKFANVAEYEPMLLFVQPVQPKVKPILVFDPPPMAA